MNQQNGPYNDLTIYDRGLDVETEKSFDGLKCIFNVFMVLFIISLVPSCLLSLVSLNIIFIAISAFTVAVAYYSIHYVHHPKSEAARSIYCTHVLTIYLVLNLLFYILGCAILLLWCIGMTFAWLSKDEPQGIMLFIIVSAFIFLFFNWGFALPYSLLMIGMKRLEIAEKMNAVYIKSEAFQSSQQVPNADIETQYMPSTNTFQPQVMPRGQVLRYLQ